MGFYPHPIIKFLCCVIFNLICHFLENPDQSSQEVGFSPNQRGQYMFHFSLCLLKMFLKSLNSDYVIANHDKLLFNFHKYLKEIRSNIFVVTKNTTKG